MHKLLHFIFLFLLVACLGCSEQSGELYDVASKSYAPEMDANLSLSESSSGSVNKSALKQGVDTSKDAKGDRKIIYTANLTMVVEDFTGIVEQVTRLVETHNGYIAQQNLDRMQGERRTGNWQLRVPVKDFAALLDALGELGVPTSQVQNAQDVTEEFVDLQARIANKKKLEARILQLLDRPDDKIQHVIEVERELGRVREAIEQMEGRLRFLQDQTTMTTISLYIYEEQNYQPPQSPSFSKRISSAWNNSLTNVWRFIQDAIVFIVGNVFGIAFFLICLFVGILILKRCWRKFFRRPNTSSAGEGS